MRQDDRHVREIHRHVVDRHRVAVLQPDAAAARHAGADAAVAGVKEHGQPGLGEDFVQRVGEAVVRERTAAAADAASARGHALRRPALRFAHRLGAASRVDAREGNGDVRIGLAPSSATASFDSCGTSRQPFIDREDHARHLARAVVVGQRAADRAAAPLSPKYFAPRASAAVARRRAPGARARRSRSACAAIDSHRQ